MPGTGGDARRARPALDCPVTPGAREAASVRQRRAGRGLTGDGKKDLLVGAPPPGAYLYPGPFSAAGAAGPEREFKHPR